MRMTTEHNIHRRIHAVRQFDDFTAEAWAGFVEQGFRPGFATLVNQHHNNADTLALELRHQPIHGFNLVGKLQAGYTHRCHHAGCLFERQPDEADLDSPERANGIRREQCFSSLLVRHVGCQVLKTGALELTLVHAGVNTNDTGCAISRLGETAAPLHAQQLAAALIEFVVADTRYLKPDLTQNIDRRFIMEQTRGQLGRTNHVAGGNNQRALRIELLEAFYQRGKVGGTAGGYTCTRLVAAIRHQHTAGWRQDVAVEVVE